MIQYLKLLGKGAAPYLLMAAGAGLSAAGWAMYQWGKAVCQQELVQQHNKLEELRAQYEREKSAQEVIYASKATREYTRLENDVQDIQEALKITGQCKPSDDAARLLQYFVEASRNPEG